MNKLWIFMHRCRVTFTEPGKEIEDKLRYF